jgi:HSP20 family protein
MALVRFTRRQPRIGFPIPSFTGFAGMPTFEDVENRMRKFVEGTMNMPFEAELLPQMVGWIPPTEISETDQELLLTSELPGMDRKDIDINVEDGVLTVRGEKKEELKKEEGEANEKKYYLVERNYGSFERSFALPTLVDANKISAEFDKGVLKVHLPKTAEAKVKGRKIEVALPK